MPAHLGINYCAPKEKIGFRGVSEGWARLIPLPQRWSDGEFFFEHGVGVPAELLPYYPDMGPNSEFRKKGYWYHYEIDQALFVVKVTTLEGAGKMWPLLYVAKFKDEESVTVLLDRRQDERVLTILTETDRQEIEALLSARQIVLPAVASEA